MTKQFTTKQLTVIDAVLIPSDNWLDHPRLASILIEFTENGGAALAKAQAGAILAALRRQQGNVNAVFSESEYPAILKFLDPQDFLLDNDKQSIRGKLLYGAMGGTHAKRLKDAVACGAASDIADALAKGYHKPAKSENEKTSAAFLVRANGERVSLTDAQYAACLAALKLNEPATF